ncbi:hypothetical protein EDP1_3992 [Pseudomonas putida S610]|nr:hypothetical protein EDP1_3992 [Pseudomonas putida S610]
MATNIGGGEEHGLDKVEILLLQHSLHEHGTNHAAPTDQTYTFHRNYTFAKSGPPSGLGMAGQRDYRFRSAATTASPISCVPTLRQPSEKMSPVRKPWSSTRLTACSMASAAADWSKL